MTALIRLALLRGINVGGRNSIKMTDLKKMLENAGYADVETYIQSGNVIFRDSEPDAALSKLKLEVALRQGTGAEIRTALLSPRQMRHTVEAKPAGFGEDPENYRYDVIFLTDPSLDSAAEIVRAAEIRAGIDFLHAGEGTVYVSRLKWEISKSLFPKIIMSPVYARMTIRNWNTTRRLSELAEARNAALPGNGS
jgi:uncharacterized protein (DUF1697 family)